MTSEPVEVLVLSERPAVRNDVATELDAVVEIRCRYGEQIDRAAGAMNLCLVIDRSGSMGDGKLEQAKQSCAEIFRRTAPGDQFTVVAFDDEAVTVVNPQTPSDQVENLIAQLEPRGMTNLSLGWFQGLLLV